MLKDLKKLFASAKPEPNSVVELVENLITESVSAGASDIHFEPVSDGLIVKYRLDGELNTIEKLPANLMENIITRLKVLGGLLTYRNDIPQEGRLETGTRLSDKIIDQRLSTFPTIYGQRAVVRNIYQHDELSELEQLGFSENILGKLKKIASQSQGVVLLTGPAGSGKSTTLAAILRHILNNSPGKSIVTLEDPVEIKIDGATQVQINPFGKLTFPQALRSLLRQDPQILMVGEIRDAQTSQIVIEAGFTGHLLMSTMHSGSAAGGLLRLLEMGIEAYQVTSSICAVVNQRLVRKLCENCKSKNKQGDFAPVGCEKCFDTGFKGRALIAELIEMDGALRKAILAQADIETLENILHQRGHMTIEHNGRELIAKGITTTDEMKKVCGI